MDQNLKEELREIKKNIAVILEILEKPKKRADIHNTAIVFCREVLIEDPEHKAGISFDYLYSIYCQWCKKYGYYMFNRVHFGKAISTIFPKRKKKTMKLTSKRKWCITGINFQDGLKLSDDANNI